MIRLLFLLTAIPAFQDQPSGTTASFRGVSAVSESVAWVAGSKGAVLRTIDGGARWESLQIPDSSDLDFRDVHAEGEQLAYVLSAGPGPLSKLFKTTDGGKTWTLLLTNPDEKGFLDAIAFWDADHGLIMGDPVDGQFVILRTDDGGKTWDRRQTPPALPGEGAFAASGSCLIVSGRNDAWFATGGKGGARVFRSTDQGRTWQVAATPVRNDIPTAGIYGLAVHGRHLIAVGGSYDNPKDNTATAALSLDAGQSWKPIAGPAGFRSAAAFTSGGTAIIAVGSHGASYSSDLGQTWNDLPGAAFHALSLTSAGSGWAVGGKGRITRVHWNMID
jgi:photosystem II stability/assembly factor-like uncharacterized protein